MPTLTGLILAFGALVLVAPFAPRLGRNHRRRLRGSAYLLLGFGSFLDPPRRRLIEAHQREEETAADSGEPKDG